MADSNSESLSASLAERLGELEAEIAAVEQQRAAIEPEDFARRLDLKERLRDLRVEMSRLRKKRGHPVSLEQAQHELRDIERRLTEIDSSHLDVVKQAGGGSAGGDFAFATDAHRLNQQIDEAAGRSALERRAEELRRWIARMD